MKNLSIMLVMLCSGLSLFTFNAEAKVVKGKRSYSGWESSYNRQVITHCPKYCDAIAVFSEEYQVPKNLIISVIKAESNFNPKAVSHKGAKGLMQLMDFNSVGINPFNPGENIEKGTQLLSRLLTKYRNVPLALAAYNAGEGNVAKYKGIPPFEETKIYIQKVMAHYKELDHASR